jgi:hypothetical protein
MGKDNGNRKTPYIHTISIIIGTIRENKTEIYDEAERRDNNRVLCSNFDMMYASNRTHQ